MEQISIPSQALTGATSVFTFRAYNLYFWWSFHLLLLFSLLMKVFSHPGYGNSKCCIVANWIYFIFLKMFHLSSERILQFWLTCVFVPPFSCYRKKVLDFYQRACLSGYCSAFAYKPMQVSLSDQLNGKCVELTPGPCLFFGVELPSTTPIKHSSCRNSWSSDGTILTDTTMIIMMM